MALRPRGHFLYLCDATNDPTVAALIIPAAMAWARSPQLGQGLSLIALTAHSSLASSSFNSLRIYLFSREDWEQIYCRPLVRLVQGEENPMYIAANIILWLLAFGVPVLAFYAAITAVTYKGPYVGDGT